LRKLRGMNATRYGNFMFLRTKLKELVDKTIMPVLPAKKAVVQALASDTPTA
jgi:hypothetical protein